MRTLAWAALLLGAAVTMGPASAADDGDDDEIEFTYDDKLQACAACHGEKGDQPPAPNYPVIAGQYPDYLEEALKAYRSGRRQDPIMGQQMEMLGVTDDDIKKFAEYFAAQPGLRVLRD